MIRFIKRELKKIRYYSASRRATLWTRLADWSLIVSFALAVPAVWWCNANVARAEQAYGVVGLVQRDAEGVFSAHVADRDAEARVYNVPRDEQFAYHQIDVDRLVRGFPLETSVLTRQPIITLREVGTAREMSEIETEERTPVGESIRTGVRRSGVPDAREIADLWQEGGARTENNWLAWIAGSFLWWVTLFVSFSIVILVLRLFSIAVLRSKSARWDELAKQGLCPHCGYDLRGLEFSERCPECGELQE